MRKTNKTKISKEIFIIAFAVLLLLVAGGFSLGHFTNNESNDNDDGNDMMGGGMMSGMGSMMKGMDINDMEEMHEKMHGKGGMGMQGMMSGMSSEEMLEMHESMHGKITNETERQEMLEHMKNCPMMNKEN